MHSFQCRDMEFDLEEDREGCLYGLEIDEKCKPPDVLRVTQIFTEADSAPDSKPNAEADSESDSESDSKLPFSLFKGGATADDLVQGQLEDCWFLAALATVCTASTGKNTNWIEEHICVAHHPRIGVYGFIFFRNGCWEDVVIDDLLFVHSPKYETLPPEEQLRFRRDKRRYDTEARTGSKSLYFASSGTEGETWVPLIEKAFAKLNGDYAALNYGFVCDAVESLTGGIYNCFHLHDVLDRDKFWNEELMKVGERGDKDRVFSCVITDPFVDGDGSQLVRGLKTEHAYSVIDAIEHPETKKRFLKIRNPWGSGGEWDGPWSDGSSEWTQLFPSHPDPSIRVKVDVDKLNHTFGNDGQFIMEYDDFMSTWSYVDRTKLFDRSWVYSFHWLNVSARPRPSAWSPGDVSFTVKIAKRTPAIFVLSQLDDRAFQELSGCYKWSLDFVVYKEGPEKREVGRSTHERLWRRSVNLELDNLEEGTYIVHVRLDRKHKEQTYMEVYHKMKAGSQPTPMPGSYHAVSEIIRGQNVVLSRPYLEPLTHRRKEWDERKLYRKWSRAITSKRLASNFAALRYGEMIPISYDFLGGRDLRMIQGGAEPEGDSTQDQYQTAALPAAPSVWSRISSLSASSQSSSYDQTGPFAGFMCGHCQNPVGGPFWRCFTCYAFDICKDCHDQGRHHADHHSNLVLITTREQARELQLEGYARVHPDDEEITVGLRVYTLRQAEPSISGTLRQGRLLRRAFNDAPLDDNLGKTNGNGKHRPDDMEASPSPQKKGRNGA